MMHSHATQEKILNAAAIIYSLHGAAATTLRAVAELADVDLAVVDYYFHSKNSLIRATVVRGLMPAANERFALLRMAEGVFGANIQPAHIISCIIVPTLLQIKHRSGPEGGAALLTRAALDDTIYVREAIKQAFQPIDRAFVLAFGRGSSERDWQRTEWQTTLFCGDFPGSVCNHSLISMCELILSQQNADIFGILLEFGFMAQTILSDDNGRAHTQQLIADVVVAMSTNPTFIALQQHLPLKHHDRSVDELFFWPR